MIAQVNLAVFSALSMFCLFWGGMAPSRVEAQEFGHLSAQDPSVTNKYFVRRRYIAHQNDELNFSKDLQLSPVEQEVDHYLRTRRQAAISHAKDQGNFVSRQPFYSVRSQIQTSEVFRVLRTMPKGGLLHVHAPMAGRMEWVITNLTYRSDCYIYRPGDTNDRYNGTLCFISADQVQANPQLKTNFVQVNQLRKVRGSALDKELSSSMRLEMVKGDSPQIWDAFFNCLVRFTPLVTYQPIFADYWMDAFETLIADGIQYVELRVGTTLIPSPPVPDVMTNVYNAASALYDLDGRSLNSLALMTNFAQVRSQIRQRHPAFDFKLILSYSRGQSGPVERDHAEEAFQLRQKFPDLVAGFDLVGDEDDGKSTGHFARLWLLEFPKLAQEYGVDMPCFFHDGESYWASDHNLLDAGLLAQRIGHGFNLYKYPAVESVLRLSAIPLEICPISNQALGMVPDLRIHPAIGYLQRGVQCVLGSDDPTALGNDGLTYDFWEVFMAWDLNLVALKKLARNSLEFSAMTLEDKENALALWHVRWDAWATEMSKQIRSARSAPQGNSGG